MQRFFSDLFRESSMRKLTVEWIEHEMENEHQVGEKKKNTKEYVWFTSETSSFSKKNIFRKIYPFLLFILLENVWNLIENLMNLELDLKMDLPDLQMWNLVWKPKKKFCSQCYVFCRISPSQINLKSQQKLCHTYRCVDTMLYDLNYWSWWSIAI